MCVGRARRAAPCKNWAAPPGCTGGPRLQTAHASCSAIATLQARAWRHVPLMAAPPPPLRCSMRASPAEPESPSCWPAPSASSLRTRLLIWDGMPYSRTAACASLLKATMDAPGCAWARAPAAPAVRRTASSRARTMIDVQESGGNEMRRGGAPSLDAICLPAACGPARGTGGACITQHAHACHGFQVPADTSWRGFSTPWHAMPGHASRPQRQQAGVRRFPPPLCAHARAQLYDAGKQQACVPQGVNMHAESGAGSSWRCQG